MASGASFNPTMTSSAALNSSVQKTSSVNEVQAKAAKDTSNTSGTEDELRRFEGRENGQDSKEVEVSKRSTEALKEINDGFARLRMDGLVKGSFVDSSPDFVEKIAEIREAKGEATSRLKGNRQEVNEEMEARAFAKRSRDQEFESLGKEAAQARVEEAQSRQEAYEVQAGNERVQTSQREQLAGALDALKSAAQELRSLTERVAASDQSERAEESRREYEAVLSRLQRVEEQRNEIQQQLADTRAEERVEQQQRLQQDRIDSVEKGRQLFRAGLDRSVAAAVQREKLLSKQDAIKAEERATIEGREQKERLAADRDEDQAQSKRLLAQTERNQNLLQRQLDRVDERNDQERQAFLDRQESSVVQNVQDGSELAGGDFDGAQEVASQSAPGSRSGIRSLPSLRDKASQSVEPRREEEGEQKRSVGDLEEANEAFGGGPPDILPDQAESDLIAVFERTGETQRPVFVENENLFDVGVSKQETIDRSGEKQLEQGLSRAIEEERRRDSSSVFDVELPKSRASSEKDQPSKTLDGLQKQLREQRAVVEKQLSNLQRQLDLVGLTKEELGSNGPTNSLDVTELSKQSLEATRLVVAESRIYSDQVEHQDELDRQQVLEVE